MKTWQADVANVADVCLWGDEEPNGRQSTPIDPVLSFQPSQPGPAKLCLFGFLLSPESRSKRFQRLQRELRELNKITRIFAVRKRETQYIRYLWFQKGGKVSPRHTMTDENVWKIGWSTHTCFSGALVADRKSFSSSSMPVTALDIFCLCAAKICEHTIFISLDTVILLCCGGADSCFRKPIERKPRFTQPDHRVESRCSQPSSAQP